MCLYKLTKKDIELVIRCFQKVWANLKHLENL